MKRRILILGGIFIVGIVTLSVTLINRPKHASSQTSSPAAKNVVTKTVARPSTIQLTASNYTSTAKPDEPSYISLPTIGAGGYVQKVGIDQYGQMAAPTNVHLAGWYINSLLPGQAGLSVIDGHVDGYAHNQGIFGQISQLSIGDVFSITFGDGSHKSFIVKRLQLVDASNVPNVLFAHDPAIDKQLNLITCGGDYDTVSHTYDKRTIITSALIS